MKHLQMQVFRHVGSLYSIAILTPLSVAEGYTQKKNVYILECILFHFLFQAQHTLQSWHQRPVPTSAACLATT